ncbi:MAG: DUF5677 domain-containing protein [Phycisphaerae bacterium]|nr:DUF5677 domain-containing protein [Phycisphaerae bacterium]
MPTYSWRKRLTRHFGEQWVAFADVHVLDHANRARRFSLQIDTGAVISLLRASAAKLLGIEVEAGKPLSLSSVGGAENRVFVHTLWVSFGVGLPLPTQVAISRTEDVPNLLGRLDVLDRLQLLFDPSLRETVIAVPWLDEVGRRMWGHLAATSTFVAEHWDKYSIPAPVDLVARRIINRADQLIGTAQALEKLHRASDMPLVLRSLFELAIQFEYILKEDEEARSQLYLDYAHISKWRLSRAWLNYPGTIGDSLRNSPLRAVGDPALEAKYNLHEHKYLNTKNKVRPKWHAQQISQLAESVNRTAEYDAIYGLYSAWAHGDPWVVGQLEQLHGGLMEAFRYWGRIIRLAVDRKKMVMEPDAYNVLKLISEPG